MVQSFTSAAQSARIITNSGGSRGAFRGRLPGKRLQARSEILLDRTFVMIKPDGVQRGLVGEIVSRFEAKGLKLVAARFEKLPEKRVTEQYQEHLAKPFFPSLKNYIMSGPCFLMVWEGRNVVAIARTLIGATNPQEAAPGTIRGDFGIDIGRNIIHGSDSPQSASREIGIHFQQNEPVTYSRIDESVMYEY
jgi:nucleoside-diphosphate kinase